MAGILTLKKVDVSRRKITRHFEFVPSATAGQGYTTGGDTLNFITAANGPGDPRRMPPGAPTLTSSDFTIKMVPGGYEAEILAAAVNPTLANYLLKLWTSGGTELSQADYPAGLAGKKLEFSITTATGRG